MAQFVGEQREACLGAEASRTLLVDTAANFTQGGGEPASKGTNFTSAGQRPVRSFQKILIAIQSCFNAWFLTMACKLGFTTIRTRIGTRIGFFLGTLAMTPSPSQLTGTATTGPRREKSMTSSSSWVWPRTPTLSENDGVICVRSMNRVDPSWPS